MPLIPLLRSACYKTRRSVRRLNRMTGFNQEKRDWLERPGRWDRDGNPVDIDSLSGWRETVRVHDAGIKR